MTDNLLKVKDSIFKKHGCVWNGVRKKVFRIQVVLLILVLAAVSLDFMGLTALASTNTLSSTALPVADSGVGTQYYPFFQAGDFDNDGDIDILYQDGGMGTSVSFYKNNGSGVFTDDGIGHFPTTTNLNLNAPSFRAADYDNDGDLDIYCRQAGASNDSYFTNDGAGYFTPSSLPIADSGSNDIQWQACDFDGDGDVDILTQDGGAGTIIIYKNNGNGTSYVASPAITGSIAGLYLNILSTKIADFDNDGDMDIYARVTGGTSSSPNDIYLINDGFGNLTSAALPIPDTSGSNYTQYQVADMDNDGDVDFLTQDAGKGGDIRFFENNGSGVYTDQGTGRITGTKADMYLAIGATKIADYDNDGDLDIYARADGASNDLYFINNTVPSKITSYSPASNASNVGLNDNITLTLSNSSLLSKGSGQIYIRIDNGDGDFSNDTIFESIPVTDSRVALTGDSSSTTVIINPSGTFAPNTTYYLVIPPAAFLDGEEKGFVTAFGSRLHPGIPDPAKKQAGNSLHGTADRTVLSFSTISSEDAVNSVTVTPAAANVVQGGTQQLTATVSVTGGAAQTVSWTSSGVAQGITVDGSGLVSAAANATPGDYTITATSTADGSKSGTATITVMAAPAVNSVTVSPAAANVVQGGTQQLTATVSVTGGAAQTVSWTSSGVAQGITVDGSGLVSAAANATPGDYTITATSTADGSKSGTATITVTEAPAVNSVTISPAAASVAQGGTQQLTATVSVTGGAAQTVSWTSSGVAQGVTVDGSGLVSAAANATTGEYTITATSTADGSKSGTATITVTAAPAVNSVTVSPASASVVQGGTQQLTATVSVTGGAAQTVSWTSSGVAQGVTVDGSGLVSASANATPGDYTITATSTADGSKSGTATITVTAAPAVNSVTVSPAAANVVQGGTQQLTATVSVTGGAAQTVNWTSSGVAQGVTVDGSGLVSASANATPGDYTITATSTADGSKSGTVTITVTAAPAVNSVTVSPASASVMLGGTQQLTATVSVIGGEVETVNWTSSGVAQGVTVDGSGLVSAAANATPGEYTITAASTADGSKSGTATITVTSPGALVLNVTPGNSLVKLSWASVTGAAHYKIYKDNILVETLSASENGYDVTGLVNGTIYTFEVKAADSNMIVIAASGQKTATPTAPSGSSTTQSSPPVNTNTGADILVNGKTENAGTVTTIKQGLQTVTTVSVDARKLEQRLEAEGNKAVVTIPVNVASDVVAGELNGQMVKIMESKEAVLEIKTGNAAYTLPAQQINIDAVAAQLGANVELKDIKVKIQISKPAEETVKFIENSADKGNFAIVAPPVEFTVSCTYCGQTATVSSFNSYVERTIAIPEGIDPNKITTGVVNEPDGTVRHVPTKVTVINGKYYAVINSLTNSTYSVVWHPLEFKDSVNHWAMDAINDMGSRMVISGVGNGLFEPGRDITRAEFAAIIVRALGLKPGVGTNSFMDVDSGKWYCDYIKTAADYKIITGYSSGKFGPEDKITREQAMTMIAKAMKITRLEAGIEGKDTDVILSGFGDSAKAAAYAKESIAACVNAEIVTGKSGRLLAPKDKITRAEVAVIVRKLLQKSNLI